MALAMYSLSGFTDDKAFAFALSLIGDPHLTPRDYAATIKALDEADQMLVLSHLRDMMDATEWEALQAVYQDRPPVQTPPIYLPPVDVIVDNGGSGQIPGPAPQEAEVATKVNPWAVGGVVVAVVGALVWALR